MLKLISNIAKKFCCCCQCKKKKTRAEIRAGWKKKADKKSKKGKSIDDDDDYQSTKIHKSNQLDDEEHRVATKIQAVIRGYLGRQRVLELWEQALQEADDYWLKYYTDLEDAERRRRYAAYIRHQYCIRFIDHVVDDSINYILAASDAATTIQRTWRGHYARMHLPKRPIINPRLWKKVVPKGKLSQETLRRVWARSIFKPSEKAYLHDTDVGYEEYDMFQYIDQPPKGEEFGLRTQKLHFPLPTPAATAGTTGFAGSMTSQLGGGSPQRLQDALTTLSGDQLLDQPNVSEITRQQFILTNDRHSWIGLPIGIKPRPYPNPNPIHPTIHAKDESGGLSASSYVLGEESPYRVKLYQPPDIATVKAADTAALAAKKKKQQEKMTKAASAGAGQTVAVINSASFRKHAQSPKNNRKKSSASSPGGSPSGGSPIGSRAGSPTAAATAGRDGHAFSRSPPASPKHHTTTNADQTAADIAYETNKATTTAANTAAITAATTTTTRQPMIGITRQYDPATGSLLVYIGRGRWRRARDSVAVMLVRRYGGTKGSGSVKAVVVPEEYGFSKEIIAELAAVEAEIEAKKLNKKRSHKAGQADSSMQQQAMMSEEELIAEQLQIKAEEDRLGIVAAREKYLSKKREKKRRKDRLLLAGTRTGQHSKVEGEDGEAAWLLDSSSSEEEEADLPLNRDLQSRLAVLQQEQQAITTAGDGQGQEQTKDEFFMTIAGTSSATTTAMMTAGLHHLAAATASSSTTRRQSSVIHQQMAAHQHPPQRIKQLKSGAIEILDQAPPNPHLALTQTFNLTQTQTQTASQSQILSPTQTQTLGVPQNLGHFSRTTQNNLDSSEYLGLGRSGHLGQGDSNDEVVEESNYDLLQAQSLSHYSHDLHRALQTTIRYVPKVPLYTQHLLKAQQRYLKNNSTESTGSTRKPGGENNNNSGVTNNNNKGGSTQSTARAPPTTSTSLHSSTEWQTVRNLAYQRERRLRLQQDAPGARSQGREHRRYINNIRRPVTRQTVDYLAGITRIDQSDLPFINNNTINNNNPWEHDTAYPLEPTAHQKPALPLSLSQRYASRHSQHYTMEYTWIPQPLLHHALNQYYSHLAYPTDYTQPPILPLSPMHKPAATTTAETNNHKTVTQSTRYGPMTTADSQALVDEQGSSSFSLFLTHESGLPYPQERLDREAARHQQRELLQVIPDPDNLAAIARHRQTASAARSSWLLTGGDEDEEDDDIEQPGALRYYYEDGVLTKRQIYLPSEASSSQVSSPYPHLSSSQGQAVFANEGSGMISERHPLRSKAALVTDDYNDRAGGKRSNSKPKLISFSSPATGGGGGGDGSLHRRGDSGGSPAGQGHGQSYPAAGYPGSGNSSIASGGSMLEEDDHQPLHHQHSLMEGSSLTSIERFEKDHGSIMTGSSSYLKQLTKTGKLANNSNKQLTSKQPTKTQLSATQLADSVMSSSVQYLQQEHDFNAFLASAAIPQTLPDTSQVRMTQANHHGLLISSTLPATTTMTTATGIVQAEKQLPARTKKGNPYRKFHYRPLLLQHHQKGESSDEEKECELGSPSRNNMFHTTNGSSYSTYSKIVPTNADEMADLHNSNSLKKQQISSAKIMMMNTSSTSQKSSSNAMSRGGNLVLTTAGFKRVRQQGDRSNSPPSTRNKAPPAGAMSATAPAAAATTAVHAYRWS